MTDRSVRRNCALDQEIGGIVTEDMAVEIVETWLRWHAADYPRTSLAATLEARFPVSFQQAHRYIPRFLVRASKAERFEYLMLGWPPERPAVAGSPSLEAVCAELEAMRTAVRSAIDVLTVALERPPGRAALDG